MKTSPSKILGVMALQLLLMSINCLADSAGTSKPFTSFDPLGNYYGLGANEPIPDDRYNYCRIGNFLGSGSDNQLIFFNNLTCAPFSSGNNDLLLSSTNYPFAALSLSSSVSDWSSPSANGEGQIRISTGTGVVNAFRKLHFNQTAAFSNGLIFSANQDPQLRSLSPEDSKLIIHIHGWNPSSDRNAYAGKIAEKFDQISQGDEFKELLLACRGKTNPTSWTTLQYHWEADADTGGLFTGGLGPINGSEAAHIGYLHGWHLADLLHNKSGEPIQRVHFIAHSAGSWVARNAAIRLNALSGGKVDIQITLCDPFIPGALSSASLASGSTLNTARMSETDTLAQPYLLENYFADDLGALGTKETFDWRFRDRNLQVTKASDLNTLIRYTSHAGPILYYADSIKGIESPVFNRETEGWERSMFMNEPILNSSNIPSQWGPFTTGDNAELSIEISTRKKPQGDPNLSIKLQKLETGGSWVDSRDDLNGPQLLLEKRVRLANITAADAGTYRISATYNQGLNYGTLTTNGAPFELVYQAPTASPTITDLVMNVEGNSTTFQSGFAYDLTVQASFSDDSSATIPANWSSNSTQASFDFPGRIRIGSVSAPVGITVTATVTRLGETYLVSRNFKIIPASSTNTPDPEPKPPIEVTENGGFEGRPGAWDFRNDFQQDSRFANANSGTEYAYLANPDGTPGNNLFGTLEQPGLLPFNASSATLEFYYSISTVEIDNAPNDFLSVQILNNQRVPTQFLQIYSDLDATTGYRKATFDMSNWIGKEFTIQFLGTTNANFPTVFRIDDVSVTYSNQATIAPTGLSIIGPRSIDESTSANYQAVLTLENGNTRDVSVSWTEDSSALSVNSSGRVTASSVSGNRNGTLTATYRTDGTIFTATKSITVIDNAETAGASGFSITVTKPNGAILRRPHRSNYQPGTEVRLTARPDPGYEFAGWQGDITGNERRVFLTMNSNKSVTAVFTPIPPGYGSLTVAISPPEAVAAGARWRVDGGSWRSSGSTLSSVQEGPHFLEFEAIAGWGAPAVREITIAEDSGNSESASYQSQTAVPIVSVISPDRGTLAGGTDVRIGGTNLNEVSSVSFGDLDAQIISQSFSEIIVRTAASSTFGSVTVSLTSPFGTVSRAGGYTYQESGNFNMEILDQEGGEIRATAIEGNLLFTNEGADFITLNISNPGSPQELSRLRLPGIPRDILVNGNLVYASCGEAGLLIIDVSSTSQPRLISSHEVEGFAVDSVRLDDYLFVADQPSGIVALDLSNPARPSRVDSLAITKKPKKLKQLKINGETYLGCVTLGSSDPEVVIIDPTNPSSLEILVTLPGSNSINDVVSIGQSVVVSDSVGPKAWSLSNISSPVEGLIRPGFDNGFLAVNGNEVILIGSAITRMSVSGSSLQIISDETFRGPLKPSSVLLSANRLLTTHRSQGLEIFDYFGGSTATLRSTIAPRVFSEDVATTGNLIMVATNEGVASMQYLNGSLSFLNSIPESNGGFGELFSIAASGGKVMGVSGGFGDNPIGQLSGNNQLLQSSSYLQGTRNTDDRAAFSDIQIIGNRVFLCGNRQTTGIPRAHVAIIDISNINAPAFVGKSDGPQGVQYNSISVENNMIYVGGSTGAAIFDASTPTAPTLLAEIPGNFRRGSAISGSYFYINSNTGIQVYDVSVPSNPTQIHSDLTNLSGNDLLTQNGFLYLAVNASQVRCYRTLDDGGLELIGSLKTPGFPNKITTFGDQVVVAVRDGGVAVIRLIDRESPDLDILFPTEPSLTVNRPTVSIAGLATDDQEIRSITWTSSAGSNGTASGIRDWSIINIPLNAGPNTIEVTAIDGLGNSTTESVSVFYDAPDEVSPALTIAGASSRTSTLDTIQLTGTATDIGRGNSGISSVLVGNLQADNDFAEASGTASWSVSYPLQVGENLITIEATDGSAAENATNQTITVMFEPDVSTFEGWALVNDLPSNSSEANDDPFQIGIPNLVAFSLGINFADPDYSRLPIYEQVEVAGQFYHALRFERSTTASSVQFILQRAGNLNGFSDDLNTIMETIDDTLPASEEVRLRCASPISSDEEDQFFRLKISN